MLLVVNAMFELPQIAQVVRAVLATCFGITCLTTLPELPHKHRPRHRDSVIQTDPQRKFTTVGLRLASILRSLLKAASPHRRPVRPGMSAYCAKTGLARQ